jgi:hypothetical protein
MDVHCVYAPDYLRRCVEVLARTGADNVGGAQRAHAITEFQRALCAALDSPLGVGGAKYRSSTAEGFVDTVFLGAFKRRVFEEVGLYDPRAITNEDAELNQRIIASGGKVFLSRDIVVHYAPRSSWTSLARQYHRYGKGRARTLLKHRRLLSVRPLLPFLGLAAGVAMVGVPALRPVLPVAIFGYALLTGLEALRVGRGQSWRRALVIWSIFPVLHFSHGLGVATGLLRYLCSPDWREPERLPAVEPESGLRIVGE